MNQIKIFQGIISQSVVTTDNSIQVEFNASHITGIKSANVGEFYRMLTFRFSFQHFSIHSMS